MLSSLVLRSHKQRAASIKDWGLRFETAKQCGGGGGGDLRASSTASSTDRVVCGVWGRQREVSDAVFDLRHSSPSSGNAE